MFDVVMSENAIDWEATKNPRTLHALSFLKLPSTSKHWVQTLRTASPKAATVLKQATGRNDNKKTKIENRQRSLSVLASAETPAFVNKI